LNLHSINTDILLEVAIELLSVPLLSQRMNKSSRWHFMKQRLL